MDKGKCTKCQKTMTINRDMICRDCKTSTCVECGKKFFFVNRESVQDKCFKCAKVQLRRSKRQKQRLSEVDPLHIS